PRRPVTRPRKALRKPSRRSSRVSRPGVFPAGWRARGGVEFIGEIRADDDEEADGGAVRHRTRAEDGARKQPAEYSDQKNSRERQPGLIVQGLALLTAIGCQSPSARYVKLIIRASRQRSPTPATSCGLIPVTSHPRPADGSASAALCSCRSECMSVT